MRYRTVRNALAAAALIVVATALAIYSYRTEFETDRANRPPIGTAAVLRGAGSADATAFRLSFFDPPRAVPDLHFEDGAGHSLSLAAFRGRPLVLNIWATWCVPCRKEMPALDRLQQAFDKTRLLVLPLSIDRQGTPVVQDFYRRLGLKSLGIYVDRSGDAPSKVGAVGVPTTLLIDRDGHEVGRKLGPAAWRSPKMIALLREHLGLPAPANP